MKKTRPTEVWDDLQQRLSWTVQGQVGQAEATESVDGVGVD